MRLAEVMKWELQKGDVIVVWGVIKHVRADGRVDVEVGEGKFLFGLQPSLAALAVEPEEKEIE